jgi:hypothetical protein
MKCPNGERANNNECKKEGCTEPIDIGGSGIIVLSGRRRICGEGEPLVHVSRMYILWG